jgi:NAD(P)-dependent dehydrogenase (short-subunit alcohol dehydrogenase family)
MSAAVAEAASRIRISFGFASYLKFSYFSSRRISYPRAGWESSLRIPARQFPHPYHLGGHLKYCHHEIGPRPTAWPFLTESKENPVSRLKGKVAVVTGGNSGIGLASAQRLQQEGARVAISGRSQKTLDEASKILGKDALVVQADVAKLSEIDKFFSAVNAKFGKIDVLFVNAGVAKFAPFAGFTEADYDNLFDINAKGAFFTVQKALPHLNDGASVILNTSVAGHIGNALGVVYGATKAAMRSFVRSMAADLAARNIRVNAIAPGPIETPIFDRVGLSEEQRVQVLQGFVASVPLKRIGKAEEIAAAVAFLASSDSSFMTGTEINVGGGVGEI